MLAWQYNAVGVSDAITMGGEGKGFSEHIHRIIVADEAVEECVTPSNPEI